MNEKHQCHACGADLDTNSGPEGLCPRCLLRLALPEGRPAPTDGEALRSTRTEFWAGEPPRTIGPYRLLHKIGEGGMGEVWKAEQQSPIRREVALKLLKAGLDSTNFLARFESERQALALMNHPNIARVLDAGTTEGGRPYFVMEYVRGTAITDYCDAHRLNNRERLELLIQVCDGVQHAHHKGVIHRDLKPSNVLVELQDHRPVPKIIDFGVAKAIGQKLTEKTMFTQLGVLVGTPAYMSPEQAGADSVDVDTRTDVYSLGVLLYELLVGALPLDPNELRQAGYEAILRRIREEEPSKPSVRLKTLEGAKSDVLAKHRHTDAATLTRELRGDLDWIALKALEKDRTRRYESPRELAQDLQRHLRHEAVTAGPPGPAYRARKFIRRHRLGVTAVGSVAVALIAGLAVATYGLIEARRAHARASLDAAAAEQVSEFLVDVFDVSDPGEARGNTITAREVLDKGVERIEQELRDQPVIRDRLRHTVGRVYRNLGLHEDAAGLLEQALEGKRQQLGPRHESTLQVQSDLGWLRVLEGRWGEAERLHAEVVETARDSLGPDHELTLGGMNRLANTYRLQGRYEEAEELFLATLAGQRRTLGEEHSATRATMVNLARLYLEQGRYEEAKELQTDALALDRRILGGDHPDTLTSMQELAWILIQQGDYEQAEQLHLQCLDGRRKVLGQEHPRTLRSMNALGNLYRLQERYDEAETLLVDAVDVLRRTVGPDHLTTRDAMVNLAALYGAQQRYNEAEPLMVETLEADRRVDGAEHPNTLTSMHELAALYKRQGRHEESEQLYVKVLGLRRRVLGEEHARTLQSMRGLADLYKRQGRYDDAHALHMSAYEGRRRTLGETHPATAASLYDLAGVSARLDRPTEALDYLRQAVDAGYRADRQQLLRDRDLDSLHDLPQFQIILNGMGTATGQKEGARDPGGSDG